MPAWDWSSPFIFFSRDEFFDANGSFVRGEVSFLASQDSIAFRSYQWPSAARTGSCITCNVMGHSFSRRAAASSLRSAPSQSARRARHCWRSSGWHSSWCSRKAAPSRREASASSPRRAHAVPLQRLLHLPVGLVFLGFLGRLTRATPVVFPLAPRPALAFFGSHAAPSVARSPLLVEVFGEQLQRRLSGSRLEARADRDAGEVAVVDSLL